MNFNSPHRLRVIEEIEANNIQLDNLANVAEISGMIGWKGLTTEHYVENGPWLLRGVEISDGLICFNELVCVEQKKYDEQPQIHLRKGDVAVTKDGTIGKAIVIPNLPKPMAAGSTVARLRVHNRTEIDPYYLECAINHPVVQIQIASFATGLAQPHITQEWLARLRIPRIHEEREIGKFTSLHHSCVTMADLQITTAKHLIESLIDGNVTEQDLIDAQEALEKGDSSLDRALLARLTTKGMDVPNAPPLFADLDALYEALSFDGEEALEMERR